MSDKLIAVIGTHVNKGGYYEMAYKHKGDVMERREGKWYVDSGDSSYGYIWQGGALLATCVEPLRAQQIADEHNEHTTLVEQRDRLTRMLATVIDANYGTSVHDIGSGDGIPEKEAEEIRQWMREYLRNALATVEQGHKELAGGGSES